MRYFAGSQTQGGTTTDFSTATLFVTPDRFTLADRDARWRFYVSAGGSISSNTIVVTNTLPQGVFATSHTVTSTSAPASVVGSVTYASAIEPDGREVLTFTVPANPGLPPGTRLQFDVFGQVQACTLPGTVDIRLTRQCGGVGACSDEQSGQVELLPGPTSLLSSNDQTANLPLCEEGTVELLVKNTSAQSPEYGLIINDFITNATFVEGTTFVTVTDETGAIVDGLASIPFTPTIVSGTVGSSQQYTLTWNVSQYLTTTQQYQVLAERQAGESILIRFRVKTNCASDPVLVQSFGLFRDVCNRPLPFQEDSRSLLVDRPMLIASKQVRNVSEGGASGNLSIGGSGRCSCLGSGRHQRRCPESHQPLCRGPTTTGIGCRYR